MDWTSFEKKFHKSWHSSVKKWIESNDCNKVYKFLKSQKGKEIAPKSSLTFRSFEQPLNKVKVVVLVDEPYSDKYENTHFADGIALSCEYVDSLHTQLRIFYETMEREFYGFNLNTIQNNDLNYLTNQGVLFLSSSLTVEIGFPGSHKGLWTKFIGMLIKKVFSKKGIPIIFCGENLHQEYKNYLNNDNPIYPYFVIEQSLQECKIGQKWETNNKFLQLNEHLEACNKDEIMWVHLDVPF